MTARTKQYAHCLDLPLIETPVRRLDARLWDLCQPGRRLTAEEQDYLDRIEREGVEP